MPSGTMPSRLEALALAAAALLAAAGVCLALLSASEHAPASGATADNSAVLMAMAAPKTLPFLGPPALPERQQLPQMDLVMSIDIFAPALELTVDAEQADAVDPPPEEVQAPPPAPAPPAPPAPAALAAAPRQAPARPAVPPTAPPPPPPAPPPAPAAPVGLSSLEQQVFDGQNGERLRAGIAALRLDAGLESVARRRAQDMAAKGYFSHTSPTGETAFSLIDAAGIPAPYAGENIGFNNYADSSSASAVLSAFMSSPSHRANIMNGVYTRVGVAVAVAANGNKYYAVVFGGP